MADDKYSAISKLKTPDDFQNKFEELERKRKTLENQWKVNLNFYKGNQYTFYNPYSKKVESLFTSEALLPKGRVRLVSNQINAGSQGLVAKYTKTRPTFNATPGNSSSRSLKAAQVSHQLLEFWWKELNLESKEQEALLWAAIVGQGYWKITWDALAGKTMDIPIGPDGQPILNERLESLYESQLQGQELERQQVSMGDVKVEVMNPMDVFLDTSTAVFEESKFVICRHYLDPEEVKARWGGGTLKPDTIPTDSAALGPSLMPDGMELTKEDEKTLRCVYIGYFKPGPQNPKGRYVVWTKGKEKFLVDIPWPYPFEELPIVKFPGIRVPGSTYDSSVVEQAIPLQKELNRTISQIVEYKNLTVTPQWVAAYGQLPDTELTNEPGIVHEYNPSPIAPAPAPVPIPSMPPYVFEHLNQVSTRLNEVFNLTDVTEGKLPPNLEAGVAIDLLQEMASDKFAPTIRQIEGALERAGRMMLSLAQEYYMEPRMVQVIGLSGASQIKEFTKADIEGNTTIHVEAGSGLPRTRAGREARIQRLLDMQMISPQQAYKYMDIADMHGISAKFQASEDQAQRDVDRVSAGHVVNEEAAQTAIQAVQSGTNPQTGQPFTSEEEVMAFINHQAYLPPITADYEVYLDIVGNFMKSIEFEGLPIEIRHNFNTLYENIQNAQAALPQPVEIKPPNVSMQIKGTAGPTAASEILHAAGVYGVTPEMLAQEKPLETWVTDSADKPNVQETGNMPADPHAEELTQASIMQKLAAAEQLHGITLHQEEHKSEQAGHKTQQEELKTAQMRSKLRHTMIQEATAKKKATESDKPNTN